MPKVSLGLKFVMEILPGTTASGKEINWLGYEIHNGIVGGSNISPSVIGQFWSSGSYYCQCDFKIETEVTKEECFTLRSVWYKHTEGSFPLQTEHWFCERACMYIYAKSSGEKVVQSFPKFGGHQLRTELKDFNCRKQVSGLDVELLVPLMAKSLSCLSFHPLHYEDLSWSSWVPRERSPAFPPFWVGTHGSHNFLGISE